MAKRYHQSFRDRMHEHDAMEHKRASMRGDTNPTMMDPRRRMEMEDSGMISEDHSAVANLPQQQVYRPYGYSYKWTPEVIDDTIAGVDRQENNDNSIKMRDFHPGKIAK